MGDSAAPNMRCASIGRWTDRVESVADTWVPFVRPDPRDSELRPVLRPLRELLKSLLCSEFLG